MTKAERIFKDTRYYSRKHIEAWGIERNADGTVIGWNNLYCGDDERICTRTINAVEKELNKDRKNVEYFLKWGAINEEEFDKRMAVLDMVESTIRNARKAIA